jgi:hypothetical protein
MKHLFYFMTIAPIIWEAMNLTNIKRTHAFSMGLRAMKGKKYDDYSSSQKTYAICAMGYIAWNFVGFFTFQWPLFVAFFLFGLIPKTNIYFRWVDSFISLIVLFFLVLNSYHLHIDLVPIARGLFGF